MYGLENKTNKNEGNKQNYKNPCRETNKTVLSFFLLTEVEANCTLSETGSCFPELLSIPSMWSFPEWSASVLPSTPCV